MEIDTPFFILNIYLTPGENVTYQNLPPFQKLKTPENLKVMKMFLFEFLFANKILEKFTKFQASRKWFIDT